MNQYAATTMPGIEEALLKNLNVFVAFARNRLGDHHLAEDVVQESLIKALAADNKPGSEEATTAWFYRILRRSIIDIYRRQGARARALEKFEAELPTEPDAEEEQAICQCLHRLLPMVPEQYRELIQQVDLEGREAGDVAAELGLTRNNLTVRLHRARHRLREALAQNCRACSTHGCLDCTCDDTPEKSGCN